MKAFFCGNAAVCADVFDDATVEKLHSLCGLCREPVITKANLEQYKDELRDTEYLFSTWGMEHYTVEEIRTYFPSLHVLFYAAGTVKDFGAEFLDAGVRVFSAWGANALPVVEYAVSQILLANKGFYNACRICSAGDRYEAYRVFKAHPGNYGAKVGLLGVGMIGSAVAEKLKEHRLDVWAYDPFCSAEKAAKLGVKLTTLEDIFQNCDVISNHLANKPETVGILSRALLSSMKDTVTFINTGRGAQVDEDALADAMRARPDAAAVLDVTDPEPPVPESPFYTLPNVYLTPHIAGSSGDEVHRMAEYMATECENITYGKETRWEVSKAMLATMA